MLIKKEWKVLDVFVHNFSKQDLIYVHDAQDLYAQPLRLLHLMQAPFAVKCFVIL